MGIYLHKKSRGGTGEPPDWNRLYARLTAPPPEGRGWTYAQVNELTIPQLLHALGAEQETGPSREETEAANNVLFDRVLEMRRWLPSKLTRVPFEELCIAFEAAEGRPVVRPFMKSVLLPVYLGSIKEN